MLQCGGRLILLSLCSPIKIHEIRYNDWYRKGKAQDTTQRTDRTDELSCKSLWVHVPITHCCHGNNGPPKSIGNTSEFSVFRVDFYIKKKSRLKLFNWIFVSNVRTGILSRLYVFLKNAMEQNTKNGQILPKLLRQTSKLGHFL